MIAQLVYNEAKRDSDGHRELTQLLEEVEWPMLNQGNMINEANYDWTKVFSRLNREISFSAILNNYVYLDAKNTKEYSIYVSVVETHKRFSMIN